MYSVISGCRSCGSQDIAPVLSLGKTPLADALLTEEQVRGEEATFPLNVVFCRSCALVQIQETVAPEVLFCRDYPYYSSISNVLLEHSRANAENLIKLQRLDSNSLVVELASNDGYLLKNFVAQGIPVLGIDPAEGPAEAAQRAGVRTMCAFFGEDLARNLREQGTQADVVIANNVLAHVADLNGFVEGIAILLKETGVAVIEAPYVKDLTDRCEFDTIYHEHLCYFSVTALNALFARHGLSLNHVEHYPIHGGSLRLYVGRQKNVGSSVKEYLANESAHKLDELSYYTNFASQVSEIKRSLLSMLRELKQRGNSIAAYGAAAKGSTLVNYVGIDTTLVDFVVDLSVHKQGLYMPGVHIPIEAPSKLLTARPDYVLLLAWNFKDEILHQQQEYRDLGGRFIVPIPSPVVE